MPELDIVIPVYNEGEGIHSVLQAFKKQIKTPFQVLICYDQDTDTTLEALQDRSKYPFEIQFIKNQGYRAHGAVMTGFRASTSPAVLSFMADDDYNADKIDTMVQEFKNGADIVCASRFIKGGSMVGCRWQKALPVRIASATLYFLARLPVHDATNAFRLFSRRVVDTIPIESTQGFTYSLELVVKAHRLGWKIREVPVQWFERKQGFSRFQVFNWAPFYLRWYWYAFATTYLGRKVLSNRT